MYTLPVLSTQHSSVVFGLAKDNVNIKRSTIDCGPKKKGLLRGVRRVVYLYCTLTVDACLLSLNVRNGAC